MLVRGGTGGFTPSLLVILNKAILWTVFENCDNLEINLPIFVVTTAHADDLAPLGAKSPAYTVVINF